MAKLSAHGHEIARLTVSAKNLGGDTEYVVTYSFRSDGHIMRKLKALNIHPTTYGGSPDHTYPWRLYQKLRDPKRDTRKRMLDLADVWARQAEHAGNFIDFKGATL